VSIAMGEEINRLHVIVDEFHADFHPSPQVLKIYKSSMVPLLPSTAQSQIHMLVPNRTFDLSYDLNCAAICSDFQENIEFQFSLGWKALVHRYLGSVNAQKALRLVDPNFQVPTEMDLMKFHALILEINQPKVENRVILQNSRSVVPVAQTPSSGPPSIAAPPSNETALMTQEDLMIAMATNLASLTSRTSMSVIVMWKTIGWRIIALSVSLYGLLYLYERLTWTTKAKERALKRQFVEFASEKLQLIVSFTSASCSHQVQQEMATTFARLCQQVDQTEKDLEANICTLTANIDQLETVQSCSKTLRHKATELEVQLEEFTKQYLEPQQ
ncbi:hypothetical protein GOODEAATRI_010617, partial [Goodea atripinnis]